MYIFPSIQAKEKANRAVSIPPPSLTESLLRDIAILIIRRDKATLEELSAQFSTILEEAALLLKLTSEIHINTKSKLSTSLLLRELILANTFSAEGKQLFLLATFFPSIKFLKVPQSATSSLLWEIKDHIRDVQVPMQQSWGTPMMELRLE
jgi:hypothetical protein